MLMLLLIGVLVGCAEKYKEDEGMLTDNAPSEKNRNNIEDTAWPRTYVDALGKEIIIDKKPGNIASLWYFYPEIFVALGKELSASSEVEYLSSLSYLQGKLDGVVELGNKMEPNMETLLTTQPDFILATDYHSEIYDSLEKIAPVITLSHNEIYPDWRLGLRTVAEIIGEEQKAEEVIERLLSDIKDGRETLKGLKGQKVILIASSDGKSFYIENEVDPVYKLAFDPEVGLGLTPDTTFNDAENKTTTFEGISTVQADHIFLISDMVKGKEIMKELQQSSIWNGLTAVQKDQVYVMDTSAITGGPLATQYALESMLEALTK